MKVDCQKQPRIFMSQEVKTRLDLYIQSCESEISGLGCAVKVPGGFRVTQILLFDQEVSAASTDLDVKEVGRWMTELIARDFDLELVKVWWHSHGPGTLFWSSTDTKTIEQFDNEWMISIVGNTRGEYRARVDIYDPVRVVVDELPLEVDIVVPEELRALIKEEINLKVREKKYIGFRPWKKGPGMWGDIPSY